MSLLGFPSRRTEKYTNPKAHLTLTKQLGRPQPIRTNVIVNEGGVCILKANRLKQHDASKLRKNMRMS